MNTVESNPVKEIITILDNYPLDSVPKILREVQANIEGKLYEFINVAESEIRFNKSVLADFKRELTMPDTNPVSKY